MIQVQLKEWTSRGVASESELVGRSARTSAAPAYLAAAAREKRQPLLPSRNEHETRLDHLERRLFLSRKVQSHLGLVA